MFLFIFVLGHNDFLIYYNQICMNANMNSILLYLFLVIVLYIINSYELRIIGIMN